MQATLIYNPHSGGSNKIDPQEIVRLLEEQEFDPVYKSTSSKEDLEEALEGTQGVVIVAGGDGSVRAVATRIIGQDLPLVILPLGTANNIANNLGVEGSPEEIIASIGDHTTCYFDIGYVQSPWGKDYFLESFGYGLFAEMLEKYGVNQEKSVIRGIESITETFSNYHPHECNLNLDGEDISGSYLLVEAHNTPALGPRLQLAPEAKTDDGLIDVVLIESENRDGILDYLARIVTGKVGDLPSVEIIRGKKLEIAWTGFVVHVDEEVRPSAERREDELKIAAALGESRQVREDSKISVEAIPHALEVWVPLTRQG